MSFATIIQSRVRCCHADIHVYVNFVSENFKFVRYVDKALNRFFLVQSEAALPVSEEEEHDQLSSDINNMGMWSFIKSVWNAS